MRYCIFAILQENSELQGSINQKNNFFWSSMTYNLTITVIIIYYICSGNTPNGFCMCCNLKDLLHLQNECVLKSVKVFLLQDNLNNRTDKFETLIDMVYLEGWKEPDRF